jgi:hypothetical protein
VVAAGKIPTSVIVTLVGIALTAWLLPAFTKQWDDRQKARELKAALVADIASSSAKAMVQTDRARSSAPGREVLVTRAGDLWLLASVDIEARLRAYFPADLVAAWQVYTYFVDRFVGVPEVQASAALARALTWMRDPRPDVPPPPSSGTEVGEPRPPRHYLPRETAKASLYALAVLRAVTPRAQSEFPLEATLDTFSRVGLSYADVPFVADKEPADLGLAAWEQEAQLLNFEETVAALVLAAHPTGYSTTTRDLIHDLLPF